jgi:hypothetical protein
MAIEYTHEQSRALKSLFVAMVRSFISTALASLGPLILISFKPVLDPLQEA